MLYGEVKWLSNHQGEGAPIRRDCVDPHEYLSHRATQRR
jgi:hypothetical protein